MSKKCEIMHITRGLTHCAGQRAEKRQTHRGIARLHSMGMLGGDRTAELHLFHVYNKTAKST